MSAGERRGSPGGLTILRPVNPRRFQMTKEYTVAANGQVVRREFPGAKVFRAEQQQVDGIEALHRLLVALEADPAACVIRGAPVEGTDLQQTLRRKVGSVGGAFADVPRAWIMLDMDKIPLPAGLSTLAEPAEVARFLRDFASGAAPELEDATAIVQLSSSAGIAEMAEAEAAAGLPGRWGSLAAPGTISGHVWFWLRTPLDGVALKRWAEAVNARAGAKAVDPATLRTIQPHYVARPVFRDGLVDPLHGRRTLLVQGLDDAVDLQVPEPAARAAKARAGDQRASFDWGLGFAARLARIGSKEHGFHEAINSAIGSFVNENWPAVRDDAEMRAGLVRLVQEAVAAADPDGRSEAQMARYADGDQIAARLAWVVQQQEAKDAEARARTAADEAVAPSYPDRAVPLAESSERAGEAISAFADRMRAGERPELLLRLTVGAGKTEVAIRSADVLLDAARAGGGEEATTHALYFLVPRHDLGDELAARLRQAKPGLQVATWRGMDAADPNAPGKTMCVETELVAAAKAAGLSASDACAGCPLREAGCAYQRQRSQRADVWLAAHNMLFQSLPTGLPRAAAIVVDESFWQCGLSGQDNDRPILLPLSRLGDDRTGDLRGQDRDRLIDLRTRAQRALQAHEDGLVRREAFEAEQFTAETAAEWKALEWLAKPKLDFSCCTSREAVLAVFKKAGEAGFSRLRPALAGHVAKLLGGDDVRSVNLEKVGCADLGRGQHGEAVRLAWREDFAAWAADRPKLLLDATAAPALVRVWCPDLEVVDIEVAAAQRVQQVIGREFGRSFFLQNAGNVSRLADVAVAEVAAAGGGEVLLVAQLKVRELLAAELGTRPHCGAMPVLDDDGETAGFTFPNGARLHLAHHGGLTGLDRWRGVDRLVVVGRPAVNRLVGERQAEIVRGAAVARQQDGDAARWPVVEGGIRLADGRGVRIDQRCHPDPLVEGVRWSITEASVLQAIGRARGVQRAEPVPVLLLGDLALPLAVETVARWEDAQPDRLTVAASEAALAVAALPLAPADLAAVRLDLWPTPKAVERDFERRSASKTPQTLIRDVPYKGLGGLSDRLGLRPARYRKPGARAWSEAMVPAGDSRAALESLVGPLAAFELVSPVQPAAAPEPVPEAAEPFPPQAPEIGGLVVLGEDPPLDLPPPVAPPTPPPDQRLRLVHLAERLEAVRPPRLWGDFTDVLRVEGWQQRCAAAHARWRDAPDTLQMRRQA